MVVYRIQNAKFGNELSGEGAKLFGGRWNSIGLPAIYTSGSIALAALEIFVHADNNILKGNYVALTIDLPKAIQINELTIDELPLNWQQFPAPDSLRTLGDIWLSRNKFAVLKMPSTIIPQEYNFIINPLHKNFIDIQVTKTSAFTFDTRFTSPHYT